MKELSTDLKCEEAKDGAIRWAIGSANGLRSSTWRLWSNKKGDFYISTRHMGHLLKASFHRDRNCHAGFTSEYADTARKCFPNVGSRHWAKWTLPNEPLVRAIQIVLPASELRSFTEANEPAQICWLPIPASDSVSVVSIFIAQREGKMNELWPGSTHGTLPLGVISTENRIAWAIYNSNTIDAATKILIEDTRSKVASKSNGSVEFSKTGMRAVILCDKGDQEDPRSKYFLELALS